jgi:plasmid maintenance system killer protein
LDVLFANAKLRKEFNSEQLLLKHHGDQRAKIIKRRMKAFSAASVLEDLRNAPGRCHELRANLAGRLALDLDGPYRLLFEPADDPIPVDGAGRLDWSKVTAIRILGVENYHE